MNLRQWAGRQVFTLRDISEILTSFGVPFCGRRPATPRVVKGRRAASQVSSETGVADAA